MVIVFIYSKNNDLNFLGHLALTTSIIAHSVFAREQSLIVSLVYFLIQFTHIDIIDNKNLIRKFHIP